MGKSRTKKANKTMKKFILCPLVAVLMMLTSCVDINMGKIKPSDVIVEKEYAMEAFSAIDVDAVANVKFVQSTKDDYRVTLKAPDNYIDFFNFEVEDNELNVKFTHNNINIVTKDVQITIYAPMLKKIENSGVAGIIIEGLKGSLLKIDNSGVGTLKLKDLSVDRLSAECSGVGNIKMSGVADKVILNCSGVGSIEAKDLKARCLKGEVSGVGGIECQATDTLKATVSGVGALKYAGNPKSTSLHRTGIGNISEL